MTNGEYDSDIEPLSLNDIVLIEEYVDSIDGDTLEDIDASRLDTGDSDISGDLENDTVILIEPDGDPEFDTLTLDERLDVLDEYGDTEAFAVGVDVIDCDGVTDANELEDILEDSEAYVEREITGELETHTLILIEPDGDPEFDTLTLYERLDVLDEYGVTDTNKLEDILEDSEAYVEREIPAELEKDASDEGVINTEIELDPETLILIMAERVLEGDTLSLIENEAEGVNTKEYVNTDVTLGILDTVNTLESYGEYDASFV